MKPSKKISVGVAVWVGGVVMTMMIVRVADSPNSPLVTWFAGISALLVFCSAYWIGGRLFAAGWRPNADAELGNLVIDALEYHGDRQSEWIFLIVWYSSTFFSHLFRHGSVFPLEDLLLRVAMAWPVMTFVVLMNPFRRGKMPVRGFAVYELGVWTRHQTVKFDDVRSIALSDLNPQSFVIKLANQLVACGGELDEQLFEQTRKLFEKKCEVEW